MTVMKQMKLFLALAVALTAGVAAYGENDTFVATNEQGIAITYTVSSATEVYVGDYTNAAISTDYIGDVVIPDRVSDGTTTYNVTALAYYAFSGCELVTGVTLPQAIKTIPPYAFQGCNNLEDDDVENILQHVETIDRNSFMSCLGLVDLVIPEGVKEIRANAFDGCLRIASVVMPSSLTSVAGSETDANRIFHNCPSLKKATIRCPMMLRDVYSSSYYDHPIWITFGDHITDYVIGAPVTRIGHGAFRFCTNVMSVKLPSTLQSIGDGAFEQRCEKLSAILVDLVSWCKVVYDETMVGYPMLSAISSFEVEQNDGTYEDVIDNVVIPEGIETINPYAFWNFTQMKQLTIASTVTSIGKEAFAYLDSERLSALGKSIKLQKVTSKAIVPPTLGENAFANMPSNVILYVPTGCLAAYEQSDWADYFEIISETVVAGNTFASDGVVYRFVDVEARTVEVAGYVGDATALAIPSSINFANLVYNVKGIGDGAFQGNNALTEITLPSSLTYIGSNAFSGCTNLKTFYCNAEEPPTLGTNAFDASVTAQSNIYVIDGSAYTDSPWANYFSFVRYATIDGYRVPVITLSESEVLLGTGTGNLFDHPNQVNSFTVPDYVFLSDGKQAKRYAIVFIDLNAFVGCTNLTSLYLRGDVGVNQAGVVFDESMAQNCTLYVPEGVEAPGWADNYFKGTDSYDPAVYVEVNGQSYPFVILAEDSDPVIGNIVQFGCGYGSGDGPKKVRGQGWRATPSTDTFVLPEEIEYNGKTYSVQVVGASALYSARFTTVDLPSSIGYIDKRAFGSYLEKLILHSTAAPELQSAIGSSLKVYVPLGHKDAYSYWEQHWEQSIYEIGGKGWTFTNNGCNYIVDEASDGVYTAWVYGYWPNEGPVPAISLDYVGSLTVPETVEFDGVTYTVTGLSETALAWCEGLTDLVIPRTVTYIGEDAFYYCTALASITCLNPEPARLGSSFTLAPSGEYVPNNDCGMVGDQQPSQTSIVYVPQGSVPAYYEAWSECFTRFREVGADWGVGDTFVEENEDGDEISYMVTGLSPNTVQTYRAYYDDMDEGYVYLPAILTDKEDIAIPRRVTHEGKTYAVTGIGPASFYGCTALKSVSIPEGVTRIGMFAVSGATSLQSVTLPRTLTRIDGSAFRESSLTSVRLPSSVRDIGYSAFRGSSKLKSVTIGSGIKDIYGCAFANCGNLKSVYIHVDADSIPKLVVSKGFNGTDIVDMNVFDASTTRKLYVPAGSVEAYTAADWSAQGGFGGGIEEMETKSVKISSAGMATYTSLDKPLDFSNVEGMKAFYVSDFDATTRNLELTRLDEAPVGVGMVFKAEDEVPEEGITFQVPVVDYANGPEQNMLVAITQTMDLPPTETIDGVDYTNFVLTRYKAPTEGEQTESGEESSEDEGVVGFYRFSETQLNYPAGKAYLHIPTSLVNDANGLNGSTVKGFVLNFGDAANEPGNIATILERLVPNAALPTTQGIYSLSGQRVSKAQKGLYIVYGKKVVIK